MPPLTGDRCSNPLDDLALTEIEQKGLSKEPSRSNSRLQIQISHLLILTTACAIVAAVLSLATDWKPIPLETRSHVRVRHLIMTLIYGSAVAGFFAIAWHRWRAKLTFPAAPGHWLMLFLATAALIEVIATLITNTYNSMYPSSNASYYSWNIEKLVLCTTMAINCFVFAYLMRSGWRWAITLAIPGFVLVALAPLHVLALTGIWRQWFVSAHTYATIVTAIVMLPLVSLAAVNDRQACVNRDWPHWLGVSVFITLLGAGLIGGVHSYFWHPVN